MGDTYKPTGWRISVALRKRLTSFAKRNGQSAERLVNTWLEDRLLKEELKEKDQRGKPILEKEPVD
jgi:hypothetical protein